MPNKLKNRVFSDKHKYHEACAIEHESSWERPEHRQREIKTPPVYQENWQSALQVALQFTDNMVSRERARVDKIVQDVVDLKKCCNELRESQSIIVPITTLDPEPFDLCKDILAVVQPDGDSFVATFFDANINASGNTQVDAVANLKDMLIALFVSLEKELKLAKGPARQLAILRKVLRKKG